MTAVLTSTRFGAMLVPPYDFYLSQAMIRLGEYAPEEFATWAPYLEEGDHVFDVGANIGCHTLPFAEAVGAKGSVTAIEPQFMLYASLCGSIALNGLNQVRALWCALGAEPGSVRIPPMDYSAQNNFGGIALADSRTGEAVGRITLDSLKLEQLDFLKIDVEGMEMDVLRGAGQTIKRCRPVISAEGDRKDQVPALLEWFRSHDYRAWWHLPPLGAFWPGIVSVNLFAIPAERGDLPEPLGHIYPLDAEGMPA